LTFLGGNDDMPSYTLKIVQNDTLKLPYPWLRSQSRREGILSIHKIKAHVRANLSVCMCMQLLDIQKADYIDICMQDRKTGLILK
jgi:hypothetical protein